jgi:hypothetical protein
LALAGARLYRTGDLALISRLRAALGVTLPVRVIFMGLTAAEIAVHTAGPISRERPYYRCNRSGGSRDRAWSLEPVR